MRRSGYRFIRNWLLVLKPGEWITFDLDELRLGSNTAGWYVRRASAENGVAYKYRLAERGSVILVRRRLEALDTKAP